MSIAATVAPELPMLRRFARLLAGSQASGDAYVVATLEALSADPSAFPSELPPRQALYKIFVRLWSSALPPATSPTSATTRQRGGAKPRRNNATAPASVPAAHGRGFFARGSRGHSRQDARRSRRFDRSSGTRDRRPGRHRSSDHRGRTDDRLRHRSDGAGARPRGDRHRPHARRSDRSVRAAAGVGAGRHPTRRRQSGSTR